MRFKSRVVVITGASMGIGEAMAQAFLAEGARVVLVSRDLERVEAARARLGRVPVNDNDTLAFACDVRRREQIDALLQAALQRFGRVDIWINNAGHGLLDSVALMNMEQCRSMFETNLFGAIQCMQAVVPVMRRQGGGTIVNVSSVAGHITVPGMAAYSATKFALNAISKAARVELKRDRVHVLTVCPGYIATDFAINAIKGADRQRLGPASRRGISAERVARATLDGVAKRKREIIVPWHDRLLIKFYQLLPSVMEWGMARMLRPADQVIAEAIAARPETDRK
jgi:short-subunit dehydrogenase